MTPAVILVCTTLVTTVPHGSIAQNNCIYIDPPFTGTKTAVVDVPVEKVVAAKDVLPIAPAVVAPVAVPVAMPIVQVAKPMAQVAKPIMQVTRVYKAKIRLNKPKLRRKIAHLTTFRRYGNFVVLPAGNEIAKKKERLSFWEELKRSDLLN